MTARHVRTRYERTRSRTRSQARAALAIPVTPVADPLTPATKEAASDAMDTAVTGMRPDGLPAEHPESMDLELAPADEVWLAMISDTLWPCDEYQQIVAEDFRQRRDGAS
jgi:hypothetical protein